MRHSPIPRCRKRRVRRPIRGSGFEDLVVLSQLVGDDLAVQRISADPDDDKYIACAIAGRASLIATGDPDLLDLRHHAGVRITTPREFVTVLQR